MQDTKKKETREEKMKRRNLKRAMKRIKVLLPFPTFGLSRSGSQLAFPAGVGSEEGSYLRLIDLCITQL